MIKKWLELSVFLSAVLLVVATSPPQQDCFLSGQLFDVPVVQLTSESTSETLDAVVHFTDPKKERFCHSNSHEEDCEKSCQARFFPVFKNKTENPITIHLWALNTAWDGTWPLLDDSNALNNTDSEEEDSFVGDGGFFENPDDGGATVDEGPCRFGNIETQSAELEAADATMLFSCALAPNETLMPSGESNNLTVMEAGLFFSSFLSSSSPIPPASVLFPIQCEGKSNHFLFKAEGAGIIDVEVSGSLFVGNGGSLCTNQQGREMDLVGIFIPNNAEEVNEENLEDGTMHLEWGGEEFEVDDSLGEGCACNSYNRSSRGTATGLLLLGIYGFGRRRRKQNENH